MPPQRKAVSVGGNFMKALYATIFSLSLTFAYDKANGQVDDQNMWQTVLEKTKVDSTFIFGRWTEKGETETRLTYLGQVNTKHGQTFKIVNSLWLWGLSQRATSRILVFNSKNQYVGN